MNSADVKIGSKYKVINNTDNKQIPVGTIITITSKYSSEPAYADWFNCDYNAAGVYARQNVRAIMLGPTTTPREDFIKIIADAEAVIVDANNKLAYMKEAETEEFDQEEYRCFQALSIAEDTSKSKIERAKALRTLIK
jgi:hypothetical protein